MGVCLLFESYGYLFIISNLYNNILYLFNNAIKYLLYNIDILLVSPGWTTYAPQVNLSGKPLVDIIKTSAATEWKLTPKMVDSSIQKINSSNNKLLIFNNPGNPCKKSNVTFNKRQIST